MKTGKDIDGRYIEVSALHCGYGEGDVIKGVDFDLRKSTVTGIIGPNGSGKTTLLRAMTGTIPFHRGEVILGGRDVYKEDYSFTAKQAAFVSQSEMPLYMKALDYILLGRTPHYGKYQFFETETDFKVAEKAMCITGTSHLKDKYLDNISGGERQLVRIARALAQEPELLILDEPLSFLDIAHQVQILDLLKVMNKEKGLTIIMVLHDLNLASEASDKIILLKEGGIYAAGAPEEILNYKNIEAVYKTVVVVKDNPITKRPYVFLNLK